MQVASLQPLIRQILQSPDTDLSTISAKRVRRQILELDASITEEFIRANKDEVDALIANEFEYVNGTSNSVPPKAEPPVEKRKRESTSNDDATHVARRSPHSMTDEELARQLSSEINKPDVRATRQSRPSTSRRQPKKSKAHAESDNDDDDEPKRKKRSQGGGARGGFAKEFELRCGILEPCRGE